MTTTLLGVLIVLAFAAVALHNHGNHVCTEHHLERLRMSIQAQIDAYVAQLRKAHAELSDKLTEATTGIQAQLVEAGVAESVDLSALAAIAQQLDDLVPDQAGVEEAEEVDEALEDEVEEDDVDDEADEESDEDDEDEAVEGDAEVTEVEGDVFDDITETAPEDTERP